MNEDDEELEKELANDQMINDDDEDHFDESEFMKHGEHLDLPDSGDEEEDPDKEEEYLRDAQGEETDSDLEEYYKELGI